MSVVFRLKKSARTKALLVKVKKGKMTVLRITATFTPTNGATSHSTKKVKLRLTR